jgi:hypothetical protein
LALRKSNEELLAISAAIRDLFACSEDMLVFGLAHYPGCVPGFVATPMTAHLDLPPPRPRRPP